MYTYLLKLLKKWVSNLLRRNKSVLITIFFDTLHNCKNIKSAFVLIITKYVIFFFYLASNFKKDKKVKALEASREWRSWLVRILVQIEQIAMAVQIPILNLIKTLSVKIGGFGGSGQALILLTLSASSPRSSNTWKAFMVTARTVLRHVTVTVSGDTLWKYSWVCTDIDGDFMIIVTP